MYLRKMSLLLLSLLLALSPAALATTAITCAGNIDSAADVIEFRETVEAKYGASNVTKCPKVADVSDFKSAGTRNVLYWSSHGAFKNESLTVLNYGHSKEFATISSANDGWDKSNASNEELRVAILAACYQFNSKARPAFANIMRKTGVRVLCGYAKKAPGDGEDVTIVKRFFSRIRGEYSVRSGWQYANANTDQDRRVWTVMAYGDGCQNYKMPGYAGPSTPTPTSSTPINRYTYNYKGGQLVSRSTAPSIQNLPYSIQVASTVASIQSSGSRIATQESVTTDSREMLSEPMDPNTAITRATSAARSAGASLYMQDAQVTQGEVTMAAVTESGEGPESVVGTYVTFRQTYSGVPIHNNFLRIGVDANGVFAMYNWLKPVLTAPNAPAERQQRYISKNEAVSRALNANNESEPVVETSYMYADVGNGGYTLCYLVVLDGGDAYLVDSVTGKAVLAN